MSGQLLAEDADVLDVEFHPQRDHGGLGSSARLQVLFHLRPHREEDLLPVLGNSSQPEDGRTERVRQAAVCHSCVVHIHDGGSLAYTPIIHEMGVRSFTLDLRCVFVLGALRKHISNHERRRHLENGARRFRSRFTSRL